MTGSTVFALVLAVLAAVFFARAGVFVADMVTSPDAWLTTTTVTP